MNIQPTNLTGLIAQLKAINDGPKPPQRRGVDSTDPWADFAVAAADSARFLALGCYTPSPIAARADQVRELISQIDLYARERGLPVGARVALTSAAVIMGMELGVSAALG